MLIMNPENDKLLRKKLNKVMTILSGGIQQPEHNYDNTVEIIKGSY